MFATAWANRFKQAFRHDSTRPPSRPRRRPTTRPLLERLEDRRLLYAGALDHAFGTDGIATIDLRFRGESVFANAVAVDASGRIVVAGYSTFAGSEAFLAARLNPDGSLDTSFANSGIFQVNTQGTPAFSGVAIQPDGKIVLAGSDVIAPGSPWFIDVYRLNPNGTLDGSFNTTGAVQYVDSTDSGSLKANALALQSDGKILVGGYDSFGGNAYFAFVRLNSDGSVDKSFQFSNAGANTGQPGLVLTQFPLPPGSGPAPPNALVQALALAPDGTIVAAGYTFSSNPGLAAFAVAKYNPDGTPDADFNGIGQVVTTFEQNASDAAYGVVIQPNGDIVLAGVDSNTTNFHNRFALERFLPDGALDPAFGSGGQVSTVFPSDQGYSFATAVALQPDGKIVAAGDSGAPYGYLDFALARFNSDGSLDTNFNFNGFITTDVLGLNDTNLGNAVALQPDGKIVEVGSSVDRSDNAFIGVARYNGDSGQLQLSAPSISVLENAGTATLTVTRTGGSTGTVTVDYTTSDATATAGADYAATSGTLTFTDGQTSQTISVPITDDGTLEGGSESLNVTLSNVTGGAALGSQTSAAVTIEDPDIVAPAINPIEGQSFTGIVATFRGSNPNIAAGDYSAAFNWGDNTFLATPHRIVPDPGGGFDIIATHTYLEEGTYTTTITVSGAENMSVNSLAQVADAPLSATPIKLVVTGHKNFSGAVATFTDADPGGTLSDYTAIITWDDGTTSAGIITGTGPFTVSGTHTFGSFSGVHHITVAIADAGGSKASVVDNVIDPTWNELYVMQLYQQLLQRPADSAGLAYWSGLLDRGASRAQVALSIEQSLEYRQDEVQALYARYLYRYADPAGLATFANLLAHGGTLEQVAADIVASPEYYQLRGGGTNAGFLSALYHDTLGRNIDPSGQSSFMHELASGASQRDIASAIFASAEFRQDLIQGYYQSILGRPAGRSGLTIFTNALAAGARDEQVLADIFASDEFFAKL
jgi:uncharacterized delta-60 repeat protein